MIIPSKVVHISFFIGLLALAIFLRAYDPTADLPYDLSFSQGENTDPPWYLNQTFTKLEVANPDPFFNGHFDRPFFTRFSTLFFHLLPVNEAALFSRIETLIKLKKLAYPSKATCLFLENSAPFKEGGSTCPRF